jgi:RHS repeat-associated protein
VHERTIYEDKKKADKTAYIHQDAQGSTSMVTTNTQAIAFKNEFTPFGEEISSLDNKTLKKEDFRGYTGHKMVGTSGVIDMNARMYDPFIVRFTSPDTIIPDFSNPMAYNRYAYVYGNPVKYIDPDGHCPWLFLAGVAIFTVSATSDNTTVQAVGMTIGSLMMGGGAEMLVGKGAVFAQGATVGFTSGFIVSGGNIGESLKGGALGGLGAQLSNAIGHHLGFSDGSIGQTFAHGVSQGTISHLRGGDFRSGFIGGVLSKASGGVMEHLGLFQGDSTMDVMGGTAVSMVVGGITSDAAGGSFMDGALSAMAVHLWNEKFGSSLMMAEKGRHLYSYEKKMARHYYIPEVDINNAIIHNGAVPWYLSDDKAGITRGNDIYIRDGDYNPDTAFGMSLLIHELKHVGQYREGYLSVGTYIISTSIHGYRGSPFEDIAYKVGDSVYNDLKNRGYNNREQIWDGSLWK